MPHAARSSNSHMMAAFCYSMHFNFNACLLALHFNACLLALPTPE